LPCKCFSIAFIKSCSAPCLGELRYRLSPKGIDCRLQFTNLFNVDTYRRYSLSANQAVLDQYYIRGRMAVLRIDYYL
jgi:hypothetical protein